MPAMDRTMSIAEPGGQLNEVSRQVPKNHVSLSFSPFVVCLLSAI